MRTKLSNSLLQTGKIKFMQMRMLIRPEKFLPHAAANAKLPDAVITENIPYTAQYRRM